MSALPGAGEAAAGWRQRPRPCISPSCCCCPTGPHPRAADDGLGLLACGLTEDELEELELEHAHDSKAPAACLKLASAAAAKAASCAATAVEATVMASLPVQ